MKFVVLGGAGAMGRLIVWDLVHFSGPQDEIIIADYDLEKAKALAASYRLKRIRAVPADVTRPKECGRALSGAFVIINGVQYQWNSSVMEMALGLGAHYIDLGGLFHMTRRQLKLSRRFQEAKLLAILGMGAAPGISNMLAKLAADQLDTLKTLDILVGSVDRTKYDREPALGISYSLKTVLEEFSLPPAVFVGGRFRFLEPMTTSGVHQFPQPVGRQLPMYTLHSEVATLPLSFKNKGVREVSFRIAFSPETVERVRMLRDLGFASSEPINVDGASVRPIDVISRLAARQPPPKALGPVKQYEVVRVVAKGKKKGRAVTLIADCHCSGWPEHGLGVDIDTGTPAAIAALMLANGEVQGFGARAPEQVLPVKSFFKHLAQRRMKVRLSLSA